MPGRLRAVHPGLRRATPKVQELIVRTIMGVDGVEAVSVNPHTGSVLILWDKTKTDADRLFASLMRYASLVPL